LARQSFSVPDSIRIETERLLLRRPAAGDVQEIFDR
jgi:hypothetical protein